MNFVKNPRQGHQKLVTNDEMQWANLKVLNPFLFRGLPCVSSSTGVPKYLSSALPHLLLVQDENLIISFIFRSVWLIFQPTRLIAGAIGLSVANCFDWHSLDEPVKRESTRRIRLRQQVGSGYLFKFKNHTINNRASQNSKTRSE